MPERVFQRRLIQIAVASCFATAVHANPTGPAVVSGLATFNAVGKNLTVTNAPGTIINWQGFSIRADEVTRFVQSGAASAVLNRVTGAEHSQLLGQLLSNGKVFLINSNGVTVGAGALIDTAGFVASSLNLSNDDFLAGKFRFTDPGGAGKVTNAGTITAHSGGPVYLVAPTVENHGVITSPGGDVMLAAGKSVELVSTASPHLRVQIQAGGEALNVGRLVAEGGRVGLYGAAVRNSGLVSADSAQLTAAGTVVLKASKDVTLDATSTLSASGGQGGSVTAQAESGTMLADGRIDAKGAHGNGGEVKLLGDRVGLVKQAAVDASGRTGGGTVLVGGDYQGKNAEVQNAKRVVLAPEATITADATERGDGGRVILWSDEYTGFYGTVSARGGVQGGNGGFVETSSKDNLQAMGFVDASAPFGSPGQWLLDPRDVTITTTTSGGAFGGGNPNTFTPTADNAMVNVSTINGSLDGGTSVTITTGATGTQNGDITVANAIAKTAGGNATLTLNAARHITLNAGISSAVGALGVNLNAAAGAIAMNGNDIATLGGNIVLNAGSGGITNIGTLTAGAGTITLNATGAMGQSSTGIIASTSDLIKQGTGTLTLSRPNTYTGATTVSAGTLTASNANALGATAGGTTVASGATLNIDGVAIGAEAVTLNGTGVGAAGALQGTGTASLSGAVTLASNSTIGGAGDLTLSGAIGQSGGSRALTKAGAGTLTLSGAGANTYTGATTVSAGTLIASKAGALGATAGGTTVASGATLNINGVAIGAEAVTLNGTGVGAAGALQGTGTASLSGAVTLASNSTIGGAGDLTLSGVIGQSGGSRALTKAGAGTLTLSGANTYTGTTTVSAGTLRYGVNNALATGAVVVNDGGTYDLNGFSDTIGALTVNSGVTGGTVTTGAGTLTLGGNVTSTGGAANATISGNLALGAATRTFTTTNAADGVTISGVVSGGVGLTKAGAGTLTLSGANTYTGATTVSAGTLTASNANALGATAGGTTVASGATLNIDGVAIGAEAVTLNGTGVGAAGALQGTGTASLSGAVTLASNSTIGGAGDLTLSGVIGQSGGSRALTKAGAGTLTLSGAGANTYTGATTVSAGTLIASKAGALGATAGGTTVASGATLNINGVAIGAEAVTLNGTGVGAAGALQGTGTASLSGAVTLASDSTVGAAGGSSLALNGAVNGPGALSIVGTGGVTFGGAVGSITPLASLATSAGGSLAINGGGVQTTGAQIYDGTVTLGGATSMATTGGAITATGAVNGAAGTLTLAAGAGNISLTNSGNDFSTVVVTSGNAVSIVDANALSAGPVSAIGNVSIQTAAGAGNDITLTGNIASTGGDITLASAEDIHYGANTLSAGGRWLVYSRNPLNDTGTIPNPGNAKPNLYSCTFGGPCGATIPPTGNHRIYSYQPTLAYAADPASRQYGDPNPAFTGTVIGLVNGDTAADAYTGVLAFTSPATVTSNVGTYAINGSGLASDIGYAFAQAPANATALSITPATLTYGADAQSRIYGEPNPGLTGVVAGFKNGETIGTATAGTLAFTTTAVASSNVGTYAIDGTGLMANNGNYAFVQAPANATALAVTQRPVTLTAGSAARDYGDPNPAVVVTANPTAPGTGVAPHESLATAFPSLGAASGAVGTTPVGAYATGANAYGVTGATNANYLVTTAPGTLTINPATLTYVANPAGREYGDPNPALTGTVTGFKNGETIGTATTGALAFITAATGTSPVGSYAIDGGGLAAGNYVFVQALANATALTISPRTITLTGGSAARAYGDANPVPAPLYAVGGNGMANGENAQALFGFTVASGAAANTAVGTYSTGVNAYNVTGVGVGVNGNYNITAVTPGTLTIGQRAIQVTADLNQTKIYGEANPPAYTFAVTVGSLVPGDGFSGATTRVAGENVGPYGIQQGTLTAGPNYALTFVPDNFTITARPITITAGAGQTKIYGSADPVFGYAVASGPGTTGPAIVAGDVLVGALGRTAGENVAAYPLNQGTLTTTAPANYTITFVPANFSITPAALDVIANAQTKVYGTPDPTLTYTATGFQFADTPATVLSGALARAPGETVPGSPYAINRGTLAPNANYTITYNGANLTITPAALTIAGDNRARLYGDANPPLTATFTGLTNGDTAAAIPGVVLITPAIPASNVGNYAINVTSGANANYTITYVNGQLAITPAPLQIVADDKARAFGVPNPPFTATATAFKLGQSVGDLNGPLVFATPATTTSPPGIYAITPGGVSSGNYTISFVNGELVVGQGAPPSDQALVTAVDRSESDPTGGLREGAGGPRTIDCLTVERPGDRRVLSRCFY